jgi:hypothetical protein
MSDSAAAHYRDVQWHSTWEEDLVHLRAGHAAPAAVDEVISEVEPILARTCENYPIVADTGFRVMNVVAARGLPKLEVWFRIEDKQKVCCYRLVDTKDAEEEDDSNDS